MNQELLYKPKHTRRGRQLQKILPAAGGRFLHHNSFGYPRASKWLKKYLEEALFVLEAVQGLQLSFLKGWKGMNMTVSDQAIQLDLVAKTQGITAAENYFVNLPEALKNHLTYGALLNCYWKVLMTKKAEALVKKMKELKIGLLPCPIIA